MLGSGESFEKEPQTTERLGTPTGRTGPASKGAFLVLWVTEAAAYLAGRHAHQDRALFRGWPAGVARSHSTPRSHAASWPVAAVHLRCSMLGDPGVCPFSLKTASGAPKSRRAGHNVSLLPRISRRLPARVPPLMSLGQGAGGCTATFCIRPLSPLPPWELGGSASAPATHLPFCSRT